MAVQAIEVTVTTNGSGRRALMLGTFGFRPKATLRARALGIARVLARHGWDVTIGTSPWDCPSDAGRHWDEGGIHLANTRIVRPAAWPLAVGEMVRWGYALDPAVVHVFKPKGFGDLAGRWLRRTVPIVVDMDDWEGDGGWNDTGMYGPLQRRLFDWQERTWPPRAAALTVASRELERRAIDLGAPPERVFYVPNGLPAERFRDLSTPAADRIPARDRNDSGPAVLLYTRFVEFAPALVARLLAGIRQSYPSARVVIAGASADGRAEAEVASTARGLGVPDGIVHLGWIDPARLGEIAGTCDVAVHPFDDTVLNRSKSSVKLLELMATGIPVVTTRVGENETFIVDGESGLLVSPGDEQALIVAVVRILGDPELASRLGEGARERVRDRFLWDHLAPRVLDAYALARERATR